PCRLIFITLYNKNQAIVLTSSSTFRQSSSSIGEQVRQKERKEAFKLFNPERTSVLQSLGFGRRTDSVLGSRPTIQGSASPCRSMERSGNCDVTRVPNREDVLPFEDQVLLRGYQRSIMRFSLVDWSRMPPSFQKRTAD
ncbi:unnamed protein product, partial [Staurois parvus]